MRRTIALWVALALVLVVGACSGDGDGVSRTPTPPLETATPEPSPVVTVTPSPTATATVIPIPTPVYRLPTPYPPMALDAPGRPLCLEDWAAYDIAEANYAFCAPQGWDVIVSSSTGRMVDVWNPAFSARMAESWPEGGEGFLAGEVSVRINSEPKVSTVEEWTRSCDQFELTVSGKEAFGCVRYGEPILGIPEDVMRVAVWLDRGDSFLIVSGGFRVSEIADADKETILEMARSLQLR